MSGADPARPGVSLGRLRRDAKQITPHALDARIAENIQQHLRGPDFAYTLDITDAVGREGKDPFVWFLSPDGRRGHCEYFAGAMALMCQSLGMNARLVVGFKCDCPTTTTTRPAPATTSSASPTPTPGSRC